MEINNQGQATPPAIKPKKKKVGCLGKTIVGIVGVLVVLGIIGALTDDEEGGGGGGGGDWKYTGDDFYQVFWGFPKDEGVIYQHLSRTFGASGVEVMQATKKGNLVGHAAGDRVIWVETKRRYEDGEPLDEGYYIRRGSMEYETAMGAEKRVARYVEVTDKKMLEKIEKTKQELEAKEKAEEEAREAERKAEEEKVKAEEAAREAKRKAEEEAKKKAREEAAEQGAYELNIPVKSLCGFKLGAPPSQVRPLLQNDDGTPIEDFVEEVLKGWWGGSTSDDRYKVTYRLAKPFRFFTHATASFYDSGVGVHLNGVTLKADIKNVSKESWTKEMTTLVELIEKKFGIKFKEGCDYSGGEGYTWHGDGCDIIVFVNRYEGYNSLYLEFNASLQVSDMDKLAKKARAEAGKKTIELDANAGAGDL